MSTIAVTRVRVEHHDQALGIGESAPRISWTVSGAQPQSAYEIQVTDTVSGQAWTTGRLESGRTTLLQWPAPDLTSRSRREVVVRAWSGAEPTASQWSAPLLVETGLLDETDWSAQLISPVAVDRSESDHSALRLRRSFSVTAQVASARLYATAHGLYELELNGTRVGDQVLAPGWSSYSHRLRYQTYDVGSLLVSGANAVGASLADGWFRGNIGFEGGVRDLYGDRPGLLLQLEIHYVDGTVEKIVSDSGWRAGAGPTTATSIYNGESYDARLAEPAWSTAAFDDTDWDAVHVESRPVGVLSAPTGPPVRRIEEIAPQRIWSSPSGKTLVDFGQNLVGRLRIRVRGPRGTTVTLRHAEVLEHEELGTRPLRRARATDTYICAGTGVEIWEPTFTFHGFRYAEISGWPGDLTVGDLTAVVLHSDLTRTGWFECSDSLLNRLHDNVVWGMRGNFVDIPTDCPQRDERLGWTGDLQVFAPTAAFLYDVTGLLTSWLADLADEQAELGTVPIYVPYVPLEFPLFPTAAWGDAAVVVPWVLYERTGDVALLERAYASMTAWVDQVADVAGPDHLWNTGMQLGDWLDPSAPPDKPAKARTDRYLVATAYHARTAQLLSQAAEVLGRSEDATRYADLAAAVRTAFRSEFVSATGRLTSDAPTAYALALCFDLLGSDAQRERAGRRLVELVVADDHRIGTGFVGTPLICDALSLVGAHDTAYHLLQQTKGPSWLYTVTMGATTIWERWDSMLPDGTINPGDMTSFNHYALGAVADWMHRRIAGLAPLEPGYRRILFAPRPGGGLTTASAAHLTPYGRAAVGWIREGASLRIEVEVPAGTTAVVRLPNADADVEIGPGQHRFTGAFRPAVDDPPIPVRGIFD